MFYPWIVGRSQDLVSHHPRALRLEDLVAAQRDGRRVRFSLTPAGRALTGAVVEVVTA